VAEPAKIPIEAGRSREAEPIAMAATATTWECGGVPAFARGSPGITLHDLPAPRPQGLLQSAAPTEIALAIFFYEIEVEAI